MKIRRKRTIYEMVEIGDLDSHCLFPMSGRLSVGLRTDCDICGKSIVDQNFVSGLKKGWPNMKFHEKCFHEETDRKDLFSEDKKAMSALDDYDQKLKDFLAYHEKLVAISTIPNYYESFSDLEIDALHCFVKWLKGGLKEERG